MAGPDGSCPVGGPCQYACPGAECYRERTRFADTPFAERAAVTLEGPGGELGTLIGPADKIADLVRPEAVVDADPRAQLLADAVRALTAAARLTRPVREIDLALSDPEGGRPVWKDTGRREPEDWAEFVTQVLAAAAANVGGVETVLGGRPGSWEADGVRQLLTGTVGHDSEHLWEHRTQPVTVTLYVDELVDDTDAREPYDDAEAAIDARYDEVPDGTEAYEEHVTMLLALGKRLEEQRVADWTAWGEALAAAVKAAAARRMPGLQVPVDVVVDVQTWRSDRQEPYWPDLEWELTGEALTATPAPWIGTDPLERLQAAQA